VVSPFDERLSIRAVVVSFRLEAEGHYYSPDRKTLIEWGYHPTTDMASELRGMLEDLLPYKDRILKKSSVIRPDIRWNGTKKTCPSLKIL